MIHHQNLKVLVHSYALAPVATTGFFGLKQSAPWGLFIFQAAIQVVALSSTRDCVTYYLHTHHEQSFNLAMFGVLQKGLLASLFTTLPTHSCKMDHSGSGIT